MKNGLELLAEYTFKHPVAPVPGRDRSLGCFNRGSDLFDRDRCTTLTLSITLSL